MLHKAESLSTNVWFSGGAQKEKLAQNDEDEEEMLKKAIAMSLEEETGLSFAKGGNKAEFLQNVWFPGGAQEEKIAQNDDHEEEMLKMAIAMSLEEQ